MALGITVTNTSTVSSPQIQISVTGLVAGTYTIQRQDQINTFNENVRGADTITVITSTAVVTDREAPVGGTYKYLISNAAQTPVLSSVIVMTPAAATAGAYPNNTAWIKNTSDPTQNRNMVVENWEGNAHEAVVLSTNRVLGRKNPVVFTDIWGARSGSFTVMNDADVLSGYPAADILNLLSSGDVLLFQNIYDMSTGDTWRDMYMVVTSLQETWHERPFNSLSTGQRVRSGQSWEVGYQEVDRPPTLNVTQGIGTWGDLKLDASSNTLTYTAIAARDVTYAGTLNRYSS